MSKKSSPTKVFFNQLVVLSMNFALSSFALAQDGQARQESLTPTQKDHAQFVGRSLLMAKRKAVVVDADTATVLRDSVEELKNRLVELMQPEPVGEITILGEGAKNSTDSRLETSSLQKSANTLQAVEVSPVRKARLDKLSQAMISISDQCVDLQDKRTQALQPLSIWQRARSLLTGNSKTVNDDAHPILKSVSDEALLKLEALNTEIAAALALPVGEQNQILSDLIEQLSVSSKRLPMEDVEARNLETTPSTSTPTISTRTAHRREFAWD